MTNLSNIPAELQQRRQWVVWRDDQGAKVPCNPFTGRPAKTSDPSTWSSFSVAAATLARGGFAGLGYVFTADDQFVGIDLDSCIVNGELQPWADYWIRRLASYCEVSPSGTGVKVWLRGKSPFPTGRNAKLDLPPVAQKTPGVELYDHGRFFAVTGQRWVDTPESINAADPAVLQEFCEHFFPAKAESCKPVVPYSHNGDKSDNVIRARSYIATLPISIQGQNGSRDLLRAACECVRFDLSGDDAFEVLCEFSERCQPPWDEKELRHAITSAEKKAEAERGCRNRTDWREPLDTSGIDWDAFGREQAATTTATSTTPAAGGTVEANTTAVDITAATATTTPAKPKAPAFTRLVSSAELVSLNCDVEYLIDGMLVKGQPGIVGGRSKCLKTSTIIDLCVSLGSGTPFLGQFSARRARVAYWSGESGAATIKSKALACADAHNVPLSECDVSWCFDLPKLSAVDHLMRMYELIVGRGIEVAIVDPLYLSLLNSETAAGASNIFAMGAALAPLTELSQATGCTVLLAHHFRKSSAPDPDEPAALEELAQSGCAEWCRQWLLLARREPYSGTGQHSLWLRCGGSAGHASLWAFDADEGVFDGTADWRRWEVALRPSHDVRAEQARVRDRKKMEALAAKEEDFKRRLLAAVANHPQGETAKALRVEAGLNPDNFAVGVRFALAEGRIEACQVAKGNRKYEGYRPAAV